MNKNLKNNVISVRFSSDQADFLDMITSVLGVSSSEYIRMLVNVQMSNSRGVLNEDKKNRIDDIIQQH